MEIHVNGEPIAKVNGFSRTVSVRSDGGEITNFTVGPATRVLNLVVEQAVPANAPRLDEVEFLNYLKAQEEGLLDGDGSDERETLVERISSSEFTDEDEAERVEEENDENDENDENEGNENPSAFKVGTTS